LIDCGLCGLCALCVSSFQGNKGLCAGADSFILGKL
jgi:hypothetical protein